MEKAALMAKQAILRDAGTPSSRPNIASLEKELLELINKSGIGPQGLGGTSLQPWLSMLKPIPHISPDFQ